MATKSAKDSPTLYQVKKLRARIGLELSKTQLQYIAVHLDVAARMQDKWLEKKIEGQREFFYVYEGWDFGENRPHEAIYSRVPEEVKRAKEQLAKNKTWCENQRRSRDQERAGLATARKRLQGHFGL